MLRNIFIKTFLVLFKQYSKISTGIRNQYWQVRIAHQNSVQFDRISVKLFNNNCQHLGQCTIISSIILKYNRLSFCYEVTVSVFYDGACTLLLFMTSVYYDVGMLSLYKVICVLDVLLRVSLSFWQFHINLNDKAPFQCKLQFVTTRSLLH